MRWTPPYQFSQNLSIKLRNVGWQFGSSDFKQAIEGVLQEAIPVDYGRITCPALLLMGESEGAELKRQTQVVYEALRARTGCDLA